MVKRGFHIGLLGPRGLTGVEMAALLEKKLWAKEVVFVSTQSGGSGKVRFRGKNRPVVPYKKVLAKQERFDLFLSAAGPDWAKENLKKFFGLASFIVDESSAFRMAEDVPLVIPEINGEILDSAPKLIAGPNCTVAVIAMALYPLLKISPIRSVTAATYQSASGAGREGLEILTKETALAVKKRKAPKNSVFPRPLAGNLFPHVGNFLPTGETGEEEKTAAETRKILGLADLKISATCVRVPVERGHSAAIWAELEKPVSQEDLERAYRESPGVLLKHPYPTPQDAAGTPEILVGRLRAPAGDSQTVALWASGDNLLKGAALNAVQIAERLLPLLSNLEGD